MKITIPRFGRRGVVGRGHTFTEWGLPQVCPLKALAPYSDSSLSYLSQRKPFCGWCRGLVNLS